MGGSTMSLSVDKTTFNHQIRAAREILDAIDKRGWSAVDIAKVSRAQWQLKQIVREVQTIKGDVREMKITKPIGDSK